MKKLIAIFLLTAAVSAAQITQTVVTKPTTPEQQARAENGFFRYKLVLGGSLQARNSNAQGREATIGCHILNRMAELGRPKSYAVASRTRGWESGLTRAGRVGFLRREAVNAMKPARLTRKFAGAKLFWC